MKIARRAVLLLSLAVAGCAATPPPAPIDAPRPDLAWVIDRGWHTDLAIPAARVTGPLSRFRTLYPGAKTLVFGFGDRIFAMSRKRDAGTYAAALLPLPGAVLVTALSAPPEAAFGTAHVIRLPLPAGGDAALSNYLWNALGKDRSGEPRLLAKGPYAGSLFYAASATYFLTYTCNSWTMDGLETTGLPIPPGLALFSGQVRRRIAPLADPPLQPAPR